MVGSIQVSVPQITLNIVTRYSLSNDFVTVPPQHVHRMGGICAYHGFQLLENGSIT